MVLCKKYLVLVSLFLVIFQYHLSFGAFTNDIPQNSTCFNYTNCDGGCSIFDFNQDVIAFLEDYSGPSFDEFKTNMGKAIDILKKYGFVISDDKFFYHISLQYLCCYSVEQYFRIEEIIASIQWKPLNLTFKSAICNIGGDGFSEAYSIIALLDDTSQQEVSEFIKTIEDKMNASGIPVHDKPRSKMEPFHSTIGVVSTSYPIDQAMKEINAQIPIYNSKPMTIDSFYMFVPPRHFKLSGTSKRVFKSTL